MRQPMRAGIKGRQRLNHVYECCANACAKCCSVARLLFFRFRGELDGSATTNRNPLLDVTHDQYTIIATWAAPPSSASPTTPTAAARCWRTTVREPTWSPVPEPTQGPERGPASPSCPAQRTCRCSPPHPRVHRRCTLPLRRWSPTSRFVAWGLRSVGAAWSGWHQTSASPPSSATGCGCPVAPW